MARSSARPTSSRPHVPGPHARQSRSRLCSFRAPWRRNSAGSFLTASTQLSGAREPRFRLALDSDDGSWPCLQTRDDYGRVQVTRLLSRRLLPWTLMNSHRVTYATCGATAPPRALVCSRWSFVESPSRRISPLRLIVAFAPRARDGGEAPQRNV